MGDHPDLRHAALGILSTEYATVTRSLTSLIQVTAIGRGFIVEGLSQDRYIITWAHRLTDWPPRASGSYIDERTWEMLGPLRTPKPTVWAECLFLDPVADIAVLGSPDNEALPKEAAAYEDFVGQANPLWMRPARNGEQAWLLALEGYWFACNVNVNGTRSCWVVQAVEPIRGGKSGSPILGDDGRAIGVCCVGSFLVATNLLAVFARRLQATAATGSTVQVSSD